MSANLKIATMACAAIMMIVAMVLMVVSCEESAPADQTGIELDIDRAKPRKTFKPAVPKPAPAPKTRTGKR